MVAETRYFHHCTDVQGSVEYCLSLGLVFDILAGGKPVWARANPCACWRVRRDASTPDLLSSICSRLQCPGGVRLTGAQIRRVRRRLLTEPQEGTTSHRQDRGSVFSLRLFFWPRRESGPRWDAPSHCANHHPEAVLEHGAFQ
jgi:hypothetical protein